MLERPAAIPVDGRQSEMALAVARGTRRLLRAHGWSTVTELTLATGRRADIVAVSANGTIHIVEIKSSIVDFRTDVKWPDYRLSCDRLYFAIPPEMPVEIMPEEAGLIVADAFGATILREAPEHRLASATRRSMLLRFAQTAADRLHTLVDPTSMDFAQF
jgi:hypothetical protein